MKILIVDDFPTMRRIVKTLLRQSGYNNFLEADDGAHGIELLKSNSDVDFIICDWNMPNINGLEMLKTVRSQGSMREIPFLMVAAESEKDQMLDAVKNGVSNFIIKPFTGAALQEKLMKAFSVKRAS
ncbi:MAG: response regulator [Proteobacteria bacterium]|nr:response regulator [Pseudomonadota bacterium]